MYVALELIDEKIFHQNLFFRLDLEELEEEGDELGGSLIAVYTADIL